VKPIEKRLTLQKSELVEQALSLDRRALAGFFDLSHVF
jgi:hypothetical protein